MSSLDPHSTMGSPRRSFDYLHDQHVHPHLNRSTSSTIGLHSPVRKSTGLFPQKSNYGTSGISIRPRQHTLEVDVDLAALINDKDASSTFDGIALEEDEIKKLPKKVRAYYQHMADLKERYEEVDEILASALPSTIVTSFKPNQSTFSQVDGYSGASNGIVSSPFVEEPEEHGHNHSKRQTHVADADEDEPLLPASQSRDEKREALNKLALNVNFAVNIVLLGAKGFAVLSSSSVSLVASFVDAMLDFVSTLIIFFSSVAMGQTGDRHKYPAGKKRFEPLGVLVFSVTMIASFVQVFIESFQRALATRKGEIEEAQLSWLGIATMLATIVIKGFIWMWCSRIPSTSVRALAQDAENDVFFNIMSLAFPWLGGILHWKLLDPIGGMVLSLYIIWNWCKTLHENFTNLSGKAADGDEVARILYLVSRFKPVTQISYCQIYHVGDELIAEIDIILPHKMTLRYCHDVTETLQGLIESLDGVGRAYVHADYSSENPAQHQVGEAKRSKPAFSPRGSTSS